MNGHSRYTIGIPNKGEIMEYTTNCMMLHYDGCMAVILLEDIVEWQKTRLDDKSKISYFAESEDMSTDKTIKMPTESQHASLGKRLEDIKKQVVDLQSFIKNKR